MVNQCIPQIKSKISNVFSLFKIKDSTNNSEFINSYPYTITEF